MRARRFGMASSVAVACTACALSTPGACARDTDREARDIDTPFVPARDDVRLTLLPERAHDAGASRVASPGDASP